MCELLNRTRQNSQGGRCSAPSGDLPAMADEVVEALRHNVPGFIEFLEETHREKIRHGVEQALLTALGHQDQADGSSRPRRSAAQAPDRPRHRLFGALTAERTPSEDFLASCARSAGWPLPRTLQAVVLADPGEPPQLPASFGEVLTGTVGTQTCLLIPDPDPDQETRAALKAALRGRPAAVGHIVPVKDAASTVRWARRLLSLAPVQDGGGPESRVVFVEDHLSTLLLLQDESLAKALAGRWLRPLSGLTPRQSERLEVTLLAWLEGGGAPEAAKALQVHPQTVRYRLRQLEKLFGPGGLRDPRTRFELELALRSRRLMAQLRQRRSRLNRRPRGVGTGVRPLAMARQARVNGL